MRRQRDELYAERTETGRQMKSLQGAMDQYEPPAVDTPTELVDTGELMAKFQESVEQQSSWVRIHDAADALDEQLLLRRRQLDEAQRAYDDAMKYAEKARKQANLLGAPPNPARLQMELGDAENQNERVRSAQNWRRLSTELDQARAEYDGLSENIRALDDAKVEGIANADMPVDGLAFDDEGVTFNGVPLKQASSAEQLRVSVAIAMKLNPELRVIQVRDGSLLDSESMQLLEELAEGQDYQVWIERVDETAAVGVVIEDGRVKGQ